MGEEIELEKAEEESKNRFSDDGMETEIEVQEGPEAKPRRKKKHKKSNGETNPKSASGSSTGKESVPDTPPPEYQSQAEMSEDEDEEKKGKIKNMKKNFKNMRSTPLILAHALVVCVFLPIAIYSCDVILSVNVLQKQPLWSAVINDKNNFSQLPEPREVTGNKYTIPETLLITVQINSRLEVDLQNELEKGGRNKRQIEVDAIGNVTTTPAVTTTTEFAVATTSVQIAPELPVTEVNNATTIQDVATTTRKVTSAVQEAKTTSPIVAAKSTAPATVTEAPESTTTVESVKTEEPTTQVAVEGSNTTDGINTTIWKQQPGEYCKGIYYFYDIHMAQAHRDNTDWFDTQTATLRQKQQTLFFMFTVFGFIFLLATIALRSEMFLNDEWTSYIIIQSVLYSISMSVTVSVFAQENASGGLRCLICRLYTNCSDIDPFDWTTHWPKVPDNDTWSLIALVSFVLKLVDCILIGCVTLGFIMNFSGDPWYKSFLKMVGWIIFYPILIFTPMLGVIRYEAIPGVIPDDAAAKTAVEVFFYIGVVLWAVTLTALPIFCKLRMCSKSREDVEEEIEDEYYN